MAWFVLSLAPLVSLAMVSVFLFFVSILFSSSLPDLLWIYNLEALESSFASLIEFLLPLPLIDDFGWFPMVESRCRAPTHSDASGKMEVYRAASPVFVPTLLSGSLVVSDGFCLVCFAVVIFYVDQCWVIEIGFRFCLDWMTLRLFGVDLVVLGRFLAIGASFFQLVVQVSDWCGGWFGGGDGWRLLLSPACFITS